MTLDYGTPPPPTAATHDQIYTTLLAVLGFLTLLGMASLGMVGLAASTPSQARPSLLMIIVTEGLFLAAIVLVLFIRLVFPAKRRWPTLGLNLILLLMIPLGTALAIYGLWKVDKNLP